ncbi:Transcription factor GTE6 [Linum perenne]
MDRGNQSSHSLAGAVVDAEKVKEVEQSHSSSGENQEPTPKGKEKQLPSVKRMEKLISEFRTVLSQLTQHKGAEPFLEPVDVEGLGLHDYYEVQNLRSKWTPEEKMKLGEALSKLSFKDLTKALEIVARYNPGFEANAEEVDLDIDTLVIYQP